MSRIVAAKALGVTLHSFVVLTKHLRFSGDSQFDNKPVVNFARYFVLFFLSLH